ncbi:MAG: GNAT family N-acetyltransferase [Planctomycetota bacterium]
MADTLQRRFTELTPALEPTIEPGTLDDLKPLARFHYAAGRPGPVSRILRAIDDGVTIAVLVASMPTLNGRWRAIAWPGEYDSPDKRANARRLNSEVRVISRVIVDPRYRGLGIAVQLVRAYLDDPATPRTEALAAMAHACPFFERAGMRRIALPPSKADAKLARILEAHALTAGDLLHGVPNGLGPALRTWATARKLKGADIAVRAFAALTHPPVALVQDRGAS